MKRFLIAAALTLSFVFGNFGGDIVNAASVPAADSEDTAKWTVLLYFCGSDLESGAPGYGCASEDVLEMIDASSGHDVRFLVYCGGSNCTHDYFKYNQTQMFLIENGLVRKVGKNDLRDMGDPETLKDFLKFGVDQYPADHTAVVIWDHGGGVMGGCCYDELYRDSHLTLPEMNDAFADVTDGMDGKFDFIAYDCCNMACLELADMLVPYADYFIASEETMPGTGFEYVGFETYLVDHPDCSARQAGTALCDAYWRQASSDYGSLGTTITMVDLSKVDDFLVTFDGFCEDLCNIPTDTAEYNAFLSDLEQDSDFGAGVFDIYTFTDICSMYSDGKEDVNDAFDSMIVYEQGDGIMCPYGGLSVYVPMTHMYSYDTALYTSVGIEGNFREFVYSLPWA